MPAKNFKAVDILEALESKLAYIPGGRDRDGRPFIVISVPPELDPTTKPKLESLILYFLSIFSEETRENGLVLIVDARRGAWRVARSCVRLSTNLIGLKVVSVIVVRPDGFWDKRVDSCTKSHKDGEPIYITLARLHVCIDFSQLPYEFSGNKAYNHVEWIKKRMKIEDYSRDALELVSKMSNLHTKLNMLDGIRMTQSDDDVESYWEIGMELLLTARHILQSGRSLVSSMSRESSKDTLDAIKDIHKLLDSIELKQMDIENSWTEMERNLDTARVIEDLEQGVSNVTDWILGPADMMLNSYWQVGFDVSSSEELRQQHEKLELQCRETYGRYAELLHKIDSLPKGKLPEDLKSQRDFMDFVCRSFASRLERRRNVLITSQRFFRLVSEYFDKTSEVFDQLVMGSRNYYNFSQASVKLLRLEKNQTVLDSLERELVKEGEKLSDILSMPVKDALGREVRVNYNEDIVNVKDILDATNARKNIFNDSVELQKLSLKQIALIHMYENDAEQAVKWLNDLFNVLLRNHMEVGCNAREIQSQKEEHQSFQETAKGTYEYGGQLVNGARVLRLSCRISLENNASLFSRLRHAWRQLRSVSQEQLTRLRVCAVFHRNVEDHCTRLRNLVETVMILHRVAKDDDVTAESHVRAGIRDILDNREKLLLEVGRMVRLGRLLKTRLKEPLYNRRMSEAEDASTFCSNLTAVDAISAKLAEVTRLAEKLDARLCEAGARTRPMSIPTTVTSSASSLLSTPAVPSPLSSSSSSGAPIRTSTVTAPASTSSATVSVASVPVQAHPTFSDSAVTSSPPLLATAALHKQSTTSTHEPSAGAVASTMSAEKPVSSPTVERLDESTSQVLSRSAEDVQTTNKDPSDKEHIEGSCSESAAEEFNAESYTTATECSVTPIPCSRSESFVTSPECEEPPVVLSHPCSGSVWQTVETSKPTITTAPPVSVSNDENQTSKFVETTSSISTMVEMQPIARVKTMDEITDERSGRIMKEVTETTVLRVSHDVRLGVASYKLASNTVLDHRQHIDGKDIQNLEYILPTESPEKVHYVQHDSQDFDVEKYAGRFPKKAQTEQSIEATKLTQIREHPLNEGMHSSLREYEEVMLSTQEITRHHEDSGIEMSPIKKDDNLEGEDFHERARKL